MRTIEININEIKVGTRLRKGDTKVINDLVESIKEIGLNNNMVINQNNELLSGFHRYNALKILNVTTVICTVKETKNENENLLYEIDENLVRSELHFLDRAYQLNLKKEIYEEMYPQTKHGKNSNNNDVKSFVEVNTKTLNTSKSTLSRLLKLGKKLNVSLINDLKDLNLTQSNCDKLTDKENVDEIIDDIKNGYTSVKEVLKSDKKMDLRPMVVTPLVTPIANETTYTNQIKRVDMMDKINVEYYYGETKEMGVNIIKNNDMLQYHYFGQDYSILDKSSLICLITIQNNNLKEYIGFVSLNSPTLNKKFRNQFFGKNFFENMFKMYKGLKLLNMSRIVILPSFRGLGITKQIQNKIMNDVFSNSLPNFTDVLYIELNSIMLHTMDFSSDTFNKTFIKMKDVMSEDDYNKYFELPKGKASKGIGYKDGANIVGNTSFKFNEMYLDILSDYCTKFFNKTFTKNELNLLLEDVTDIFKTENQDILKSYLKNSTPLMFSNVECANNTEFNKISKVA